MRVRRRIALSTIINARFQQTTLWRELSNEYKVRIGLLAVRISSLLFRTQISQPDVADAFLERVRGEETLSNPIVFNLRRLQISYQRFGLARAIPPTGTCSVSTSS